MPRLEISLLGPFQATLDSQPLKGFESDKVRALLAYLVMEAGMPHRRDSLAALFWGDQPQDVALKNLRHIVYKLRQILGEGDTDKPGTDGAVGRAPYLLVSSQTVQFNSAADFVLDAGEFVELVEACKTHSHRRIDVCRACHLRLKQAADLHRGDFLAGFGLTDSIEFEEWMLLQREALRNSALDVFMQLAAYFEMRSDYSQALIYTRKQLEMEPWREEAYRRAMVFLALTGQRNAALLEYEKCRKVLAAELGIEPEAETQALYEQVKAGTLDAGSATNRLGVKHNLPAVLTPFIGRTKELTELEEILQTPSYRLVTLVGPGGVGKTRLAAEAAARQLGAFRDEVCFIPLAAVSSPELLAESVAPVLGIPLQGREEPLKQVLSYLAGKEMLLVLDNFEHLVDGVDFIVQILRHAPDVTVLATSRKTLNLQAESIFEVRGLPYPGSDPDGENAAIADESGMQRDVSGATGYAAVQLFLERAQRVQRGYEPTSADVKEIVRLCRMVAGMPLALELAAAKVGRYLQSGSLKALADAIGSKLDILSSTFRDIPEQHRSLRAVFDYSWALLSDEARRAFPRLSVFHGGFTEEAAEQVAGIDGDALEALVQQSLLQVAPHGRYEMHELLRQYAAERLSAAPADLEATEGRHAAYYLALAEQTKPLLAGSEQKRWLDYIEREHSNLRAAIQWGRDGAADTHRMHVMRMLGALWPFWAVRGYAAEGWELASGLLPIGLDAQEVADSAEAEELVELGDRHDFLAEALRGAGNMAKGLGRYTVAKRVLNASLELFRRAGDRLGIAKVLNDLGHISYFQGAFAEALPLYEESLALFRELKDKQGIAHNLANMGTLLRYYGGDHLASLALVEESLALYRELNDRSGMASCLNDLGNYYSDRFEDEKARPFYEESLTLYRELGNRRNVALLCNNLGNLYYDRGDHEEAVRLYERSIALCRELGDRRSMARTINNVANNAVASGDYDRANSLFRESILVYSDIADRLGLAECLADRASFDAKIGHIERAARIWSSVEALRRAMNSPILPKNLPEYTRLLEEARAKVDVATWEAAWSEGQAMSIEQAVEYATGS